LFLRQFIQTTPSWDLLSSAPIGRPQAGESRLIGRVENEHGRGKHRVEVLDVSLELAKTFHGILAKRRKDIAGDEKAFHGGCLGVELVLVEKVEELGFERVQSGVWQRSSFLEFEALHTPVGSVSGRSENLIEPNLRPLRRE